MGREQKAEGCGCTYQERGGEAEVGVDLEDRALALRVKTEEVRREVTLKRVL